jgi:hypothetical protein
MTDFLPMAALFQDAEKGICHAERSEASAVAS